LHRTFISKQKLVGWRITMLRTRYKVHRRKVWLNGAYRKEKTTGKRMRTKQKDSKAQIPVELSQAWREKERTKVVERTVNSNGGRLRSRKPEQGSASTRRRRGGGRGAYDTNKNKKARQQDEGNEIPPTQHTKIQKKKKGEQWEEHKTVSSSTKKEAKPLPKQKKSSGKRKKEAADARRKRRSKGQKAGSPTGYVRYEPEEADTKKERTQMRGKQV